MEWMMIVAVFFMFVLIGSFLNVLLRTTRKTDWLMTVVFSLFMAVITIGILGL
ncbi:hypothetical protein [Paenisporosarcina cavernae]|uniref:hypothetical protein n=1 Tax=Paenisporosarcina cavernae TaxID=2320858 RepID=UPI0013C4BC5D|nr:hypothetical protein [Paenisporosarcina cavernae]